MVCATIVNAGDILEKSLLIRRPSPGFGSGRARPSVAKKAKKRVDFTPEA
jgi:hypothetical protein